MRLENSSSSLWSGELLMGIAYVNAYIKQSWTSQDTYWVLASWVEDENTKMAKVSEPQVSYSPVEIQLHE